MTLSLPCTLKGRKGRYEVVSKLTEGGMSTIYVGKSKRGQAVIVNEASGGDRAQSDERREVVLIDFGAAKKEFHQFTGSGTVIYTPGWGAPEQNLGEATPASDLYSVGAVLFFLLTSQDPQASMKQLAAGKAELFRSPRDL